METDACSFTSTLQASPTLGRLLLFVPGAADRGPRPLVIAFNGGFGHGRDFIWTWLREALSRDFILMAPTSPGETWSLDAVERDAGPLLGHVEEVCSEHGADRGRVLITGGSDGGTFALGFGLGRWLAAADLAPVRLCPAGRGPVGRQGRRILWVHGALDWMFPVGRAARACEELSRSGADVRLRIIPDLAHAYPREENGVILDWFGAPSRPAEAGR